jgi:acyl-CoA reductase-like NAD-dependent aldehyde dehydrogenase
MSFSFSGRQLIAGQWVASGKEKITATNPATGEILAPAFQIASTVT